MSKVAKRDDPRLLSEVIVAHFQEHRRELAQRIRRMSRDQRAQYWKTQKAIRVKDDPA